VISYKPFIKLLIDRDIKKQDIMKKANISSATMAKLGKDEPVSLDIIDRLCSALSCQPGDLLQYISKVKSSHQD
jgi:DNA-binding Xre family transcriptional regulator